MVSELVTNVFLHARTDCLIHAEFDHSTLAVSVSDEDNQELTLPSPTNTVEGGRGLAIVAGLADSWGIQHNDGAKSVWFQLSSTHLPDV